MKALLVVDMQKDFCYKNGSLYINGVEKLFEPVNEVIRKARSRDFAIIFTQDWHRDDDSEFQIWPKHCIMYTEGSQLIDEIETKRDDYFVKKRRYSAFFGTDLDMLLRERGIKDLYVCGVATNICVLHTVSDAKLLGYNVKIIADCTMALSEFEYRYGMYHMENVLRVDVVNSSTF